MSKHGHAGATLTLNHITVSHVEDRSKDKILRIDEKTSHTDETTSVSHHRIMPGTKNKNSRVLTRHRVHSPETSRPSWEAAAPRLKQSAASALIHDRRQ